MNVSYWEQLTVGPSYDQPFEHIAKYYSTFLVRWHYKLYYPVLIKTFSKLATNFKTLCKEPINQDTTINSSSQKYRKNGRADSPPALEVVQYQP